MNVRKFILSSAVAALMGIVVIGCNENPIDTPPDDQVGNLQASSMSPTSVALSWSAPTGITAAGYTISWTGSGAAGSGSVDVTTPPHTVTGLNANTQYVFTVRAKDAAGTLGAASTITWAGASRFNATGSGDPIRMYEFESDQPSGMNLFDGSGPRNVSLKAGTSGRAQLAMFIYPKTGGPIDSVIIGPVYAMTEYRASAGNDFNKIDSSVYISATTYEVSSLNTWYLSQPLNALIDPVSNVKAYTFKPGSMSQAQGFVVRHGTAGNYHYARVVVKAVGGSIIAGAFKNRYVELEVSYQTEANVPFAKPGMRPAPAGIRATAGH